ncbi:MAG TPA: hypothetical protein DCY79_04485, partial [Planctomycetaceae bacterium]|nr:hypothetical protein [Planctomycetaceae bacterium]
MKRTVTSVSDGSRWFRFGGLALVLIMSTATGLLAVEPDAFRARREAQEKARKLAGQLVSGVLDIQIRQLRENGLSELPVYQDIVKMRSNIDRMVEGDMQEVIDLLVKAQVGAEAERLQAFTAARDKTRDLVVRLMAERQKLYRRMQIAKMAAEVRALIQLQARVERVTSGLEELAIRDRERQLLDNVEGQRDVRALYFRLVETLADIGEWGGQSALAATEGLRLLEVASVTDHLRDAGQALGDSQFTQASKSQLAVIKGLEALLERIEEARGLVTSDREAALELVRDLIRKQEELRDQTRESNEPQAQANDFVTQQTEVNQQLEDLAQQLDEFEETQALLDQAQEAGEDAESDLFEGKKDDAVLDQSKVIGSLAQIAEQLESNAPSAPSDKSAAELAEDVQQLEQLADELDEVATQQKAVVEQAKDDAGKAKQMQEEVAKTLAEKTQEQEVSPVIEAAIAEAKENAQQATEKLQDAAKQAQPEPQKESQQAAEETQQAIERAKAAVEAELADTKRKQLAVEIGELARAAEVLERTAAEQKQIANEIAQTGEDDEPAAEPAGTDQTEPAQDDTDMPQGSDDKGS